jgi:hypothetical protein
MDKNVKGKCDECNRTADTGVHMQCDLATDGKYNANAIDAIIQVRCTCGMLVELYAVSVVSMHRLDSRVYMLVVVASQMRPHRISSDPRIPGLRDREAASVRRRRPLPG